MDPDRAAQWSGREAPIVAAIATSGTALPATFVAYRSPELMIDLPSDGSLRGPLLVVLPFRHPTRAARYPIMLPEPQVVHAAKQPAPTNVPSASVKP
jgi:hypothetical protein